MTTVLTVFGTRPEAVKLVSVLRALEASEAFTSKVCATGQHRELLDPFLGHFGVEPDWNPAVMTPNQTLPELTATLLDKLQPVLDAAAPDLVLVQGDTTTAFAAALAAFYRKVPIAHVEAGLRSSDKYAPFPEELNRRLIDGLADVHFAPTPGAKTNLNDEGISADRIWVTGNTGVDAILATSEDDGLEGIDLPVELDDDRHTIVATAHRRESFGADLANICDALKQLAIERDDVEIVYPVHLNPSVRDPVYGRLNGIDRLHLIDPMPYLEFVKLLKQAHLVLTDSGGIQEEAPSLDVPVLVMRRATERPELIASGAGRLIGTDTDQIVAETIRVLDDPNDHARMARAGNPFGDGRAAGRIVAALEASFADRK